MKKLGGYFARYHDRLYKSSPTSRMVSLVAYGDAPPEPDFDQIKPGTWRKFVNPDEVSEYYDVEYQCMYQGLDCVADREDDQGRVEVLYIGNSYAAADAGMKQIDYGVWQAWVSRDELTEFHEVRKNRLPIG